MSDRMTTDDVSPVCEVGRCISRQSNVGYNITTVNVSIFGVRYSSSGSPCGCSMRASRFSQSSNAKQTSNMAMPLHNSDKACASAAACAILLVWHRRPKCVSTCEQNANCDHRQLASCDARQTAVMEMQEQGANLDEKQTNDVHRLFLASMDTSMESRDEPASA